MLSGTEDEHEINLKYLYWTEKSNSDKFLG